MCPKNKLRFYFEYLHQGVLWKVWRTKHESEVWSGAHGFSLAASPASSTQQAAANAGGARFGKKEQIKETLDLQVKGVQNQVWDRRSR